MWLSELCLIKSNSTTNSECNSGSQYGEWSLFHVLRKQSDVHVEMFLKCACHNSLLTRRTHSKSRV